MEFVRNIKDEQLICLLHVVSNIYGLNSVNNIVNTGNQVNRFAILEYFEKITKYTNEDKLEYSNDRLLSALQKSIKVRLDKVNNLEILLNTKRQMIKDIKMLFSKFFGINESNLFIVSSDKDIEDILIPYFYKSSNQISFSTNDRTLFNKVPDLNYPVYNVINTDKDFKEEDKNFYYVTKLDNILVEKLKKNPKFIIDVNSTKHNLEGLRVVSLDKSFKDEDIDIMKIYKIWSSLLFLNFDCLLN